jgi:hypothetical protein
MKITTSSAVALILSAGLTGAADAAQSEINLSSLTNANLQTYTNGTAYPTAGSTVTIGAASFLVPSDAGAPHDGSDPGLVAKRQLCHSDQPSWLLDRLCARELGIRSFGRNCRLAGL